MSAWLIGFIGIVYAVVAVSLFLEGKTGLAISFAGYVIGNIGLAMAALGK
jgi:hypothetical protein